MDAPQSNDDMATMPIRELISQIRARVKTFGPEKMIDALVMNVLCRRMEEQANTIDDLVEEIYECENNPDFHGHSYPEKT